MAVFSPIVHPAAQLTTINIAEFPHGSLVGSHTIGDDCLGPAMALQDLFQKRQSSSFIPLSRHVTLENCTFVVVRTPKVMLLSVDLGYAALPVTNTSSRCQRQ